MNNNTNTFNSQEFSSSLPASAVLDTSFVISVLFDQPNTLNNLITANYPSPSGARRA